MGKNTAKAAVLIVHHKRTLALLLRDDNPLIHAPGCWGFPALGRERDEAIRRTAIRCLKTKLQVEAVAAQELVELGTTAAGNTFFYCKLHDHTEIPQNKPGEGCAMAFFPRRELQFCSASGSTSVADS